MNLCIQKGLMPLVGHRDEGIYKKKIKKEACELKLTTRKLRSLLRATDLTNQASKSTCMQQRKGKSSTSAEFTLSVDCPLLPEECFCRTSCFTSCLGLEQ